MICQGKLGDGIKPCTNEVKIEGEKYCGIHKNKYEKIDAEKIVMEEMRAIKAEYERLNPKPVAVVSEYTKSQLDIISKIDVNDPKNSNLLVVRFPEAVKLIDFDTNLKGGLDVYFTKMTYASGKNFHWLCPNGIPEHGSFTCPGGKTSRHKIVDGKKIVQGCKVCCIDDSRIHDKDEVAKLMAEDRSTKKSTTAIGDASEIFIADLIRNTGKYKQVEKIGQGGCTADIKVTHFDDTFNYVQVKTLTKRADLISGYTCRKTNKYPDDMLLIFVDNTRKFFAMDFEENLKINDVLFNYNGRSDYSNIMYTDPNLLLEEFHELIKFSTQVNTYNATYRKEKEMLERLEAYCKANNMKYEKNTTNSNTVDGYINGHSFQAKYKGKDEKKKHIFRVNFVKNAGRLNGKFIKKPYEKGDFEFFIVELGGTFDDKKNYKGNFCVIPHDEFVKRGTFGTDEEEGNKCFYVGPPDYAKSHWSKTFWNNFTPLLLKKGVIRLKIVRNDA